MGANGGTIGRDSECGQIEKAALFARKDGAFEQKLVESLDPSARRCRRQGGQSAFDVAFEDGLIGFGKRGFAVGFFVREMAEPSAFVATCHGMGKRMWAVATGLLVRAIEKAGGEVVERSVGAGKVVEKARKVADLWACVEKVCLKVCCCDVYMFVGWLPTKKCNNGG